jgi:hypothetical protein
MKNQMNYRYFIRSDWRGRPEATTAISAKFIETLDALSAIDPIFTGWEITNIRDMSSFALAAARSRVAATTESNVVRNDFDQPSPNDGYHAVASAGVFKDPRSVTFKADAGGKFHGGTKLEFGHYGVATDLSIVTYPLFKAALLKINAIWDAPWACAQAFRTDSVEVPIQIGALEATRIVSATAVPSDLTFPHSIFHIPWIAYLSAELAAGLRLTSEILTERTDDGGLLMSVTTDRFDPSNSEYLRRARIVAETLISCTEHFSH